MSEKDVQPVAWMNVFDDVNRGSFGTPADTHLELDEAEQQIKRQKAKGLCALRTIPLYTHPPAADVQELVQALKEIIKHCPNSWAEIRADVALKIWEGK